MDCSLPGSSVHRILQARILEWVAISKGSSWPGVTRPVPRISCIGKQVLYHCTTWEYPEKFLTIFKYIYVIGCCISFLGLMEQILTVWVGLKQQKLILSQYRRPEVRNHGISRVGSSGGSEEAAVPCPSASFWGLPAVLGVPWLVKHNSNLHLCLHVAYLWGHPFIGFRAPANPTLIKYDFLLTSYICKDPIST